MANKFANRFVEVRHAWKIAARTTGAGLALLFAAGIASPAQAHDGPVPIVEGGNPCVQKDLVDPDGYSFYRITCTTNDEMVSDASGRNQFSVKFWAVFEGYPHDKYLKARYYAQANTYSGGFQHMSISVAGSDIDKYEGDYSIYASKDVELGTGCGQGINGAWPRDGFQDEAIKPAFFRRIRVLKIRHVQINSFNTCR